MARSITRQPHCNHSSYWSANPECLDCVRLYGKYPDSPAFVGTWYEKQVGLAKIKIRVKTRPTRRKVAIFLDKVARFICKEFWR